MLVASAAFDFYLISLFKSLIINKIYNICPHHFFYVLTPLTFSPLSLSLLLLLIPPQPLLLAPFPLTLFYLSASAYPSASACLCLPVYATLIRPIDRIVYSVHWLVVVV